MLFAGVDIGGTKLAAGLMNEAGELVVTRRTADHVGLAEAPLMDFVAGLVRDMCMAAGTTPDALGGVGVGMAGHMRGKEGMVITTSNLKGFKNYPLANELSSRLGGLPVRLENDANCQAWAEYRFGAGRGYDDMVFITVSTGIGAGIIINGRLYRGQSGTAGEIGHTIIKPDSDVVCTCGNRGCFMAHACTLNLDALARQKSQRYKTRLLDQPEGGPADARVDGKRVYAAARQGDAAALEIINEYADYLGIMLYNIFQMLNPRAIVMGGGLMNWELGFFEKIIEKFQILARDMLIDPLPIVRAGIQDDSGVIGAAALFLEGDRC